MDRRPHAGRIQPQLASGGHFGLPRQLDDAIVQRLGTECGGPADQRALVGHYLEVDPAEPAWYQAVGHPLARLLIASYMEVLAQQHPKDHSRRRGMSPMHQRIAIALPPNRLAPLDTTDPVV